jgi:tetratricopeptide (TPR) repeat protein
MIWLVLRRLKIPGAWLAALVFAVHPVNVESVAWITERKNTQPMVFYLLTILLYLRFESSGSRRWYFLALFSFLLALLSKTSVVMLPFVLLGCAWWQRGKIVRNDLMRAIPFFALSGLLSLVTVWFQYNAIGETVVRTDGFFSRLAGAGWAVWFYLYKALIPYKLSFVYPRWEIDATSILSYLPALILSGCFALFWRYRKSWGRPLLFGFGYYVVTLLPVLGFFNIYFMKYSLVADHWQYTSIIGIIAVAVAVGNSVWKQRPGALRRLLSVGTVALVGILCILTWRQGNIYADVETLWRDTISKNPKAWIAYNELGFALKQQGRLEEAIPQFSKALQIRPNDEAAHNNLGLALYEQGRVDEAVAHYSRALQINPDYAKAHNNLGIVLARQGRLDEAIGHYSKALRMERDFPDYVAAHYNLGVALALKGRQKQAMHYFSKAVKLKPEFAEAHYNLGAVLASQGSLEEAIDHFSEALRIRPDFAGAKHYMKRALEDIQKRKSVSNSISGQ